VALAPNVRAKQKETLPEPPKLDRNPSPLTPRFESALVYATQKHHGQTRKSSQVPYIAHILSVTALVLEAGGDEDQAIAALLHDVVEDCGGAPILEEVRQKFGDRVARIVDGCTDTDEYPKPPWRARKERYLRHLQQGGEDVRLVSMADKLHNVRSIVLDYRTIGEKIWERFTGGREGTLWYYRTLLDIYRQGPTSPWLDELERNVVELERLANATT
jgi:(p)ppGpp synthase/HD superfamily hydrolase